jgi:hypothetical protein
MHSFTQRLAERIEIPQSESISDALVDAGEIMRMWRFFGGDPSGSAVVGPFSERTTYPWMQADDIERLKQALISLVQRYPHHPQLCSAVHGLYYLAAPDTKSLLIEVLRDCIGRDSHALYQTILALEELGDKLYDQPSSTGIDEVERNERVAREYLSSQESAT